MALHSLCETILSGPLEAEHGKYIVVLRSRRRDRRSFLAHHNLCRRQGAKYQGYFKRYVRQRFLSVHKNSTDKIEKVPPFPETDYLLSSFLLFVMQETTP